jgi:2-oxoglutarate/2-oxoacid ferredoxin oxidoreductase subunit alpha
MREFISGAEAIARGSLKAGCNFFAGYPITPATPILLHMLRELPKVGGVGIQAEDEIAAIGFCLGAVMSGARAMTATSGPGISLYSENIGAAIMMELPLVIVDVQRMGPATGGATTGAQGDIQFLRWGTSGGHPLVVLSPTNIADCYTLAQRAFDLAERFRTPVFLACDKDLVSGSFTIESTDYEEFPVSERKLPSPEVEFVPFSFPNPADVPPMPSLGGPHLVRFTTSAHDEFGYLTKDPDAMRRKNQHLEAKINQHVDEIALLDADLQPGAQVLILSYGICAQSARQAAQLLRARGKQVSVLTVHSLWPVPERQIRDAIEAVSRVVIAEMNQGQYQREIERLVSDGQEVVGVNRMDGGLISPLEILEMGGLT